MIFFVSLKPCLTVFTGIEMALEDTWSLWYRIYWGSTWKLKYSSNMVSFTTYLCSKIKTANIWSLCVILQVKYKYCFNIVIFLPKTLKINFFAQIYVFFEGGRSQIICVMKPKEKSDLFEVWFIFMFQEVMTNV